MATLPDIKTSYQVNKNTRTRVLKAEFGDGYSQRAVDGINTTKDTWDLSWIGLSTSDADTLISFLEARGGVESFDWTPNGEAVSKKWLCSEWSKTFNQIHNVINVNATFEQTYDLT